MHPKRLSALVRHILPGKITSEPNQYTPRQGGVRRMLPVSGIQTVVVVEPMHGWQTYDRLRRQVICRCNVPRGTRRAKYKFEFVRMW